MNVQELCAQLETRGDDLSLAAAKRLRLLEAAVLDGMRENLRLLTERLQLAQGVARNARERTGQAQRSKVN